MDVEWDFTDNSPEFKAAVKEGVRKAVKMIAMQGASNVADLAPVDTGRLKGSISGKSNADTAIIGTNVYYAPYLEYGTYKMLFVASLIVLT